VYDTVSVCVLQRVGDLGPNAKRGVERWESFVQALA
jgi:hypothetical protein